MCGVLFLCSRSSLCHVFSTRFCAHGAQTLAQTKRIRIKSGEASEACSGGVDVVVCFVFCVLFCLCCVVFRADVQQVRNRAMASDNTPTQILAVLCLLSVVPPPRASIIRLLEFGTTLVFDGKRWNIDLKTHSDAAAVKHKSSRFHRRAVLPLPLLATAPLNELRDIRNNTGFAFRNSRGASFSSSAFTAFVSGAFHKFSTDKNKPAPAASLLRSVFVTWLNSLPESAAEGDIKALNELKISAAAYQHHSVQTANSIYDKDQLSYARLLRLVDFCEQFSLSSQFSVAVSASASASPPPQQQQQQEQEQESERKSTRKRAAESEPETVAEGAEAEQEPEQRTAVSRALKKLQIDGMFPSISGRI